MLNGVIDCMNAITLFYGSRHNTGSFHPKTTHKKRCIVSPSIPPFYNKLTFLSQHK